MALGIPQETAIFLEIGENENASRDFLRGFATMLLFAGFTPGFKANTDAKFTFDREFSRGMQTDKEIFKKMFDLGCCTDRSGVQRHYHISPHSSG